MSSRKGRALPSRARGLLVEEVGDEVVVVNPETKEAHALSGLVARVWAASAVGVWTGKAESSEVDEAVDQLVASGLLVPAQPFSRRVMLQRTGTVATLGGLVTIGLPATADAASDRKSVV